MDINFLRGVATIIVMAAFLSICWWAYFYRSKDSFQQAANLPFADEPENQESKLTQNSAEPNRKENGEHQ